MAESSRQDKGINKEVEERLPYWVRELLKMVDEAEEEKETLTTTVKRYISKGKSTKEIAKILYGDETEAGQRKVRALISKLKKRFNNNTSNSGAERLDPLRKLKGCGGMVRHRNLNRNRALSYFVDRNRNLGSQPSHLADTGHEIVKAPVAGLGSRVGFVLERDVITAVLCDVDAALAIRRLAHRVTGAGFYIYHHDDVAFQSKGDVVAVSEPNGDLGRASQALWQALSLAGLSQMQIERAVSKLKHPARIAYDELTVEVSDPEIIEIIRRCEPHIPDEGRGPYVILAPSPLLPGLKTYLKDEKLRIELVAHNEKQAFNAFFIRGELVGDVLPKIKESPGVFDEWRAQYWHPYSHPLVLNLTVELPKEVYRKVRGIREVDETASSPVFDHLPMELRNALLRLRDRGVLWYNDFRVGASERLKKAYRNDPSKVVKDLEIADNLEKRITYILLQKTVVDYGSLLKILNQGSSNQSTVYL